MYERDRDSLDENFHLSMYHVTYLDKDQKAHTQLLAIWSNTIHHMPFKIHNSILEHAFKLTIHTIQTCRSKLNYTLTYKRTQAAL